ncbi:HtaA domain-containing protein [Streptomyces sp. NPDC002896]|uniref:HtaA domain-containing protein n=1 Tax=Streptomyces sp. NPDC002896 TaxID=3154438 RepID=UPI003326C492
MSAPTRRGSLRWAVKSSFVHYVRTIAAGTCEAVGGAEVDADGTFTFPLMGVAEDNGCQVLSFGGGARFFAHRGFLDVDLRGLELRFTQAGVDLTVEAAPGARVTIATAEPAVPVKDGGLRWPGLVPCLTEAGAEIFGNVYPVGSELAPLDAVVLLD